MTPIRLITSVVLMLTVAACASSNLVQPGPYAPSKRIEIDVSTPWTAYPYNTRTKTRVLTIDGTLLNQLTFITGIKDGDSIVPTRIGDREKLVPKFRSDMGDFEIAELLVDSLTVVGMVDVTPSNVRPEAFGALDGVRVDFTGALASGLLYTGSVKAAVEGDELHAVYYYAPTEYYYGLHKDEVDAVFASVRLR